MSLPQIPKGTLITEAVKDLFTSQETDECDNCGYEVYSHACKLVCPNCGMRRDCSDP